MINDWAKPSIKLDQLHKRLDDCLNMKKHSEAFSILLEMQGEVLKLQQFVLYGVEQNSNKLATFDSKKHRQLKSAEFDSLIAGDEFKDFLNKARNDKEFLKELHAELMRVPLPGEY